DRSLLLKASDNGRDSSLSRILRIEGEWLRDAIVAGVTYCQASDMYSKLKALAGSLRRLGPDCFRGLRKAGRDRQASYMGWRFPGCGPKSPVLESCKQLLERFDQVTCLVDAQEDAIRQADGQPVVLREQGLSPLVFGRQVNPLGFTDYKLIEGL